MKVNKVFTILLVAFMTMSGLIINLETIIAEDANLFYEEYISNIAEAGHNAGTSGPGKTIVSSKFDEGNLAPNDVLIPTNRLDVPNGHDSVWYVLPERENGYIFYHYAVEYKNKDNGQKGEYIVNSVDDKIDYSKFDNPEDISRISLQYSYAAKITVNRYLNEIDESTLLETKDYFGRSAVDYTTGSDNMRVHYEADKLFVETEFSDKYKFVESDFDYNLPLSYSIDEDKVVNLIYGEMVEAGDITVKYLSENGEVLSDTKILQGEVGDAYITEMIEIPDYELIKIPDNFKGEFTKKSQEVIYVYRLVLEEDITIEIPDTPIEPEEENPVVPLEPSKPAETGKDESITPETGIDSNVYLYTSTLLTSFTALILVIRKKQKIKHLSK